MAITLNGRPRHLGGRIHYKSGGSMPGPVDPPPTPAPGSHTWWRLNITALADACGDLFVGDVQFRATDGGPDLVSGGTAFASSSKTGYEPELVFDGYPSTGWSVGADDYDALSAGVDGAFAALGYHFPSAVNVEQILLSPLQGNESCLPDQFDVQYSDDGVAWATKWSVTRAQTVPGITDPNADPYDIFTGDPGTAFSFDSSGKIATEPTPGYGLQPSPDGCPVVDYTGGYTSRTGTVAIPGSFTTSDPITSLGVANQDLGIYDFTTGQQVVSIGATSAIGALELNFSGRVTLSITSGFLVLTSLDGHLYDVVYSASRSSVKALWGGC